jgi:homotetrameric cytidine deaminase
MQINADVEKTYRVACEGRKNAYAPYSNFKVGAAVKFKGHDLISAGCNVENASYGATICAERGAILSGIASHGQTEIDHLVVVTDTDPVTVPCALCLQVLSEFCGPETPIYLGNLDGVKDMRLFKELLPMPFNTLDCSPDRKAKK